MNKKLGVFLGVGEERAHLCNGKKQVTIAKRKEKGNTRGRDMKKGRNLGRK
jgi:hypothetical protein